jgi:acyl dehydratase
MSTSFASTQELLEAAGRELGTTDWVTLTQERINQFADATGDHQWIHVDVERAKAGPFGTTIAHGYLTLALCAPFLGALAQVGGIAMGINYGIDKARFIAPVPAGSRVRGAGDVVSVTEIPAACKPSSASRSSSRARRSPAVVLFYGLAPRVRPGEAVVTSARKA